MHEAQEEREVTVLDFIAIAASGMAVVAYAWWLLGIFMQSPEEEYETCNRVMGERFKSDAEYRASMYCRR